MINNEEDLELMELIQKIRAVEEKLNEAKEQMSYWSRVETEHQNQIDNLKKEAREISARFGVQQNNPTKESFG